ncbi:MAG: lysozyme g [Myxococcaceae bacterium]|nr:lysozyme g [Myxococcaceae bacterium]
MKYFPLPVVPSLAWRGGKRYFGAPRPGRKHAGCDLIVPEGTPIIAMDDGVVKEVKEFYRKTFAIVVQHPGALARYCEAARRMAPGIGPGVSVKAGTVIAYVGKMYVDSMLHLELYRKPYGGPLTIKGAGEYGRRSDLYDPGPTLDALVMSLAKGVTTPMQELGDV